MYTEFLSYFYNYLSICLAVSGLSCSRQDLGCILHALLSQLMSSAAASFGLSSYGVWAWLLHSIWDLSSLSRDNT